MSIKKILKEELNSLSGKYEVFHGSDADFEQFSYDFVGNGHDVEGAGFYFTSSYDNALAHGKNVKKYSITLNKVTNTSGGVNDRGFSKLIEALMKKSPVYKDMLTNWDENLNAAHKMAFQGMMNADSQHEAFQNVWYDFYRNHSGTFLINLSKAGFDGVIIPKQSGITHFVVYNNLKIELIDNG